MGWEISDDRTFNHWFKQFGGKRIAIFGDCSFGVPGGPMTRQEFIEKYDFEKVETFDILGEPTVRFDLNQPIGKEHHAHYDWVLDTGTGCCCFNPAQVIYNLHSMLKVGGYVFQFGPMFGYHNRAYYSCHPALLQEFYEYNGYSIKRLYWRTKGGYWTPMEDINMFQDVDTLPNDTCVLIVAQKTHDKPPQAPLPDHYYHHTWTN